MKRTVPLAALAVLVLGAAISSCGDAARTDAAVAASNDAVPRTVQGDEPVDPILPTPTYVPDYPGPPQTASMNCVENSCDLVFIPPSDDTVRPFGVAVELLRVEDKHVVISAAGKQYVVEPGKRVPIDGATVELVGTPGAVVTLIVRSA